MLGNNLANNPSTLYKTIRPRKAASCTTASLKVGSKVFRGDKVSDGFFCSLAALKEPDMSTIQMSTPFQELSKDYKNVLELVRSGGEIRDILPHESVEVLYSVNCEVNDLYSITALHFIHAGSYGLRLFHRVKRYF